MAKFYLIIILISLFATWPFFKKGYFETHDGEWMVIRFSAFHQTLAAGQFPVRFVDRLNNNYGYPVFNFLYPLPFYLAEIPKILGFGFTDSIKLVFVFSTVASTVAMYWALSQIASQFASLAGAVLYLYIPYRFVDLYVRGSLGESLAFTFVPFIAGSIFKIASGKEIHLPILSLSVALLIFSHNVIAALFVPFFLFLALIMLKKEKLKVISFFVLGILMSAAFTIPAIYDLQYVKFSQIKISEISHHLVSLEQLIIPYWGYGATPLSASPLPVSIGVVPLILLLAVIVIRFFKRIKNNLVDFQLIIFLTVAFFLTKYSLPVWKIVPYLDIIQFPWRLLSLIVFIAAFFASYLLTHVKNNQKPAMILIAAIILSSAIYTRPKNFVARDEGFYSTNEDTTTVRDEYLPLWVKEKPANRANQKILVDQNSQVVSQTIKSTKYSAKIISADQSTVTVNTIYFPTWLVLVDGHQVEFTYNNSHGLITFQLPKGEHEVIIKYARTRVHFASELLSAVAILIATIAFFSIWRKQNS